MDSTVTGLYRLKVKLGVDEFDASGPEEVVKEQFQLFLAGRAASPAIEAPQKPAGKIAPASAAELDGLWARAYRREDDRLSLNVLPQGKAQNADAVLLLIYGHQTLLGQEGVTSLSLMDAAQQSGLRIDRIDRNMPPSHKCYVIKGGTGKGSRYSLNNRGRAYAQELLEQMFE